jgi:hypothetical protein
MPRAHGLSFGQAQALARIWLEVKARELAGHPETLRGTFTVAAAVNRHPTRPPLAAAATPDGVFVRIYTIIASFTPRTVGVDVAQLPQFRGRARVISST